MTINFKPQKTLGRFPKVIIALVLMVAMGTVGYQALAALTLDATSVVGSTTLTLNGAAASAITIGNTAQTAAITLGDTAASVVTEISIGGGDGIKTAINIGDGTAANGINIGGTASVTTVKGTLTVGVDDTGHDVKFFGATAGQSWLWDESADKMIVTGTASISGLLTASLGVSSSAQTATPNSGAEAGSLITAGVNSVAVAANTTDVNDFIVLPALAGVPVGHTITVVSNAAGHEVRTPAASNEEINSEDSDGTKEYAIAAGSQIHSFTKIDNTIGWMGQGFTAIGAVVTAVIPD